MNFLQFLLFFGFIIPDLALREKTVDDKDEYRQEFELNGMQGKNALVQPCDVKAPKLKFWINLHAVINSISK